MRVTFGLALVLRNRAMPFLVVTVSPEGVTATAVESKHEARTLASKKTQAVVIQEETAKNI
jgi:hypothetical protein